MVTTEDVLYKSQTVGIGFLRIEYMQQAMARLYLYLSLAPINYCDMFSI